MPGIPKGCRAFFSSLDGKWPSPEGEKAILGDRRGGCQMRIEGVERHQDEQELTFVRVFTEFNEQIATPAHPVIKKIPESKFPLERSW